MTDIRPAPMIDAVSCRFLTFDDDLDELVRRAEYISKKELYTPPIKA